MPDTTAPRYAELRLRRRNWKTIRTEAWLLLRGSVVLLLIYAALLGLLWLNAVGNGR